MGPKSTLFLGCGVAVLDDVLYVIGVTYTTSYGSAGVMQYVPFGYRDTVSDPSNTPTSEPVVSHNHILSYIVILSLVLTIGAIVTGYFCIFKKPCYP
jgi:hypothetical protein